MPHTHFGRKVVHNFPTWSALMLSSHACSWTSPHLSTFLDLSTQCFFSNLAFNMDECRSSVFFFILFPHLDVIWLHGIWNECWGLPRPLPLTFLHCLIISDQLHFWWDILNPEITMNLSGNLVNICIWWSDGGNSKQPCRCWNSEVKTENAGVTRQVSQHLERVNVSGVNAEMSPTFSGMIL